MVICCIKSTKIFRSVPKITFTTRLRQNSTSQKAVTINIEEARRFAKECAEAAGIPHPNSQIFSDFLVEADYKGHTGHGFNRLTKYLNDVTSGLCDGTVTPIILRQTPASAWVDGLNGLGAVVATFCMNLAVEKAKVEGVGWVCTKGSNHYGIGSLYTSIALKEGLIGMCFSNTSPILSPTHSKKAALGSNPITVGAPAKNKDCFHLDMATTAVALGKIEQYVRRAEPMPKGWAKDQHGKITSDAKAAYQAQSLMPLGGYSKTGGYKGYGLSMLVEVFSGMLSGSLYGAQIRVWGKDKRPANLGQSFVAVDPKCFAPDFEKRLTCLLDYIRQLKPIDSKNPVMIPGDPERISMQAIDKSGKLQYPPSIVDDTLKLSKSLKVKPLTVDR